jgi:hypothetical protein
VIGISPIADRPVKECGTRTSRAKASTTESRRVLAGAIPDFTTAADRVVTLGGRMSVGHDREAALVEVDLPIEAPLDP